MTWLVALTEPRAEPIAVAAAIRRGLSTFYPRLRRTVSRRGRRSAKITALFGGYVFFEMSQDWKQVFLLKGVRGVIMDKEKPILVSDDAIDAVRMRCDDAGFYKGVLKERFKAGDLVQPQSGALKGLTGRYSTSPSDGVEVALFDLLGAVGRPVEFRHGVLVAAVE